MTTTDRTGELAVNRKFSEVSLAYVKNAHNLDLARKEFEKQALDLIEQVESDLANVSRRQGQDSDIYRWRDAKSEVPLREIAGLNFRANSSISLDVKPNGLRNFKKDAAFLYFEILFDSERREFIFQSRFENQSIHEGLDDFDEKIIEIARSQDFREKFPGSNHIKASTAILYKYSINDELFENLNPRIKDAIEISQLALSKIFGK